MTDQRADIAVVGGGQLARMMQQAAVGLGVRLRLLTDSADDSAAQVIPDVVVGDYRNLDDLRMVVRGADVVTFDHEHVPPEHLVELEATGHACRPGPGALIYAQDKALMRQRLAELGIPMPAHRTVRDAGELDEFAESVGGYPVVLKAARGGYDGKGVWILDSAATAGHILDSGIALLAEEMVFFTRELSALIARRPGGEVVEWPVVESRQKDGVCKEVVAPAPDLSDAVGSVARDIALRIAEGLDVVGVMAVELFETADGRVLVNELAMRPHNTGHWTIDGALTGQFENHLRAVLDLPLGPVAPVDRWSVMVNILGGTVEDLAGQRGAVFDLIPDVRVHLYGKPVKPGRKVGHVTVTGDNLSEVIARARRAADVFEKGSVDE